MNARDPNLPVQPDEAAALADFANRTWDEEIVPALTDYVAIPAKSPMFDAEWREHGYIERVIRD
ncbi:MAG: peptidase M20, partial [Caldimonas sp.]